MMTLGISTHGPFLSWTSWRRRKPFRHTLAYWLLGLWVFELAYGVARWSLCAAIWILVPVIKGAGIALAAMVLLLIVAAWLLWRAYRNHRQEI
jgi:hypothetical protein